MMGKELEGPPQNEPESNQYRFSFTTAIEKRLEEMGATPEEAAYFCDPLNNFLRTATEYLPMGLVGLALATELEENERLPLIEVSTYWEKPTRVGSTGLSPEISKCLDKWEDPLPYPEGDYILSLMGIAGTSQFPTYEAFLDRLKGNKVIGFTGAPQKFLGSVSISELCQELSNSKTTPQTITTPSS